MVSIQVNSSGRLYYAARLNYDTVEKVNNDELDVTFDMVNVRYKLDNYDRIIYIESRYLPYHQHDTVKVYSGEQAANALTVMGPDLLGMFVADLVDLYKFFYYDPDKSKKQESNLSENPNFLNHIPPSPALSIIKMECPSCKTGFVDGQIYCHHCGRNLTASTEAKGTWQVRCDKCKRNIPAEYVDAQNVFCPYCGSKNISYFQ